MSGLVITAIMQNPAAVPDIDGEWLEVYNPGPDPINRKDRVITDDDFDNHTIGVDLLINSGEYIVLASSEGSPISNAGITAEYEYSNDIVLATNF